jgi:hypothetical protein
MNHYKSVIAAAVLMLSLTSITYADVSVNATASTSLKLKREQASSTRAALKQKIEAKVSADCTTITTRIDSRLSTFDARFQEHASVYQKHHDKLVDISTKLQADGEDVSKLNADIAVLDSKIATFSTDKPKVETDLNNTKSYTCGNSSGEFKASLETLRADQRTVAADDKSIHDFIKSTIREDIVSLQASYKAKHGTVAASSTVTAQ